MKVQTGAEGVLTGTAVWGMQRGGWIGWMYTWVDRRPGVGDEQAVINEGEGGERILSGFPSRQLGGCHLPRLCN